MDVEEAVELDGKAPAGVGEDSLYGASLILGASFGVAHVAGLEVHQCRLFPAGEGEVVVKGLPKVYYFYLIGMVNDYLWLSFEAAHAGLRGERDPIDILREGVSAVRLDSYHGSGGLLKPVDKGRVNVQGGFSAGEHDERGAGTGSRGNDLIVRHQIAGLMQGVAEGAPEVTSGEANEECRDSGVVSLSLQGVENLVDFSHRHRGAAKCQSFS